MISMTLNQIAEQIHATLLLPRFSISHTHLTETIVQSVSIDTRTILPGELFIALRGKQHDGHQFVHHAAERNAVAVVVDTFRSDLPVPQLVVGDTLQALHDIALYHRMQCRAQICGITGSVGKTTTRHLIHQVVSTGMNCYQSPRNFNNQVGVPLSLLNLQQSHEFAVIEMAASQAGDIAQLANLVRPEIGVITDISLAHLESFQTLDVVLSTKSELLSFIPEHGCCYIPKHLRSHVKNATPFKGHLKTVGRSTGCNIRADDVNWNEMGINFRVQEETYQLYFESEQFLNSALIAIDIAKSLNISPQRIQSGLDQFQLLPGRGQRIQTGQGLIIDDCYNASPTAMRASLVMLKRISQNRKSIAVLGGMLQLGECSQLLHQRIGRFVAQLGIHSLITLGRDARQIATGASQAGMPHGRIACFDEIDHLFPLLELWRTDDSITLIKGSRYFGMEKIISQLRNDDDRVELQSKPTSLRAA